MEGRWKSVTDELVRFRHHLAETFPSLQIVSLYDYAWCSEEYKASRKTSPYNCAGVYLFYGTNDELLYVGKASFAFDKRVWKHPDIIETKFIDVICFPWEVSHFCLALEHFLISQLNPRYNKQLRAYGLASESTPEAFSDKLIRDETE